MRNGNPKFGLLSCSRATQPNRQLGHSAQSPQIAKFSIKMHAISLLRPLSAALEHAKSHFNPLRPTSERSALERKVPSSSFGAHTLGFMPLSWPARARALASQPRSNQRRVRGRASTLANVVSCSTRSSVEALVNGRRRSRGVVAMDVNARLREFASLETDWRHGSIGSASGGRNAIQ